MVAPSPANIQTPSPGGATSPELPTDVSSSPLPRTTQTGERPVLEQPSEHVDAGRAALAIGDLDLAIRELDAAYKAGEPLLLVYLVRAEVAGAQNDTSAERKWLESAAGAAPDHTEPLLRLAALHRRQGLWQKAIETYDRAIELDPTCSAAYSGAAGIYSARGRPRQAVTYLENAVLHRPDDSGLLMKLGDAYRQAGMLADAEETYDLGTRSADPHLRAQMLDKLGDLYVSVGQYSNGFYCYAAAAQARGDEDQPPAQRRYEQIMKTADEAVVAGLTLARDTFNEYSVRRTAPRERAYLAAEAAADQIREVIDFARAVAAPDSGRALYLRRQVAYSLSLEAIINLMTHMDTNLSEPLTRYESALAEAEAEYQTIRRLRGQ